MPNKPLPLAWGQLAQLFDLATGEDEARLCRDIPQAQCHEQPRNALHQIIALALSKTGDALSDSKVVLPWLMSAVGAPAFMVAFLVPIRESLALLPQILFGSLVRRFSVRKGFWVAGSLIEGLCILLMGVVALTGLRQTSAGWVILGLLALFSTARGVASIAAKDTLGKTVSKGRRGRINGYSGTIAGVLATATGLYLVFSPQAARPDWLLYALLIAAGLCWLLAAGAFSRIQEYPGATEGGRGIGDLVGEQLRLLVRDKELQKFIAARTLLIATALVGPLYVTLAQRQLGSSLDSLGWLMLASGLAAVFSSVAWGHASDRSSRRTLMLAGMLAASLGPTVLGVLHFAPRIASEAPFYAAVLFVLGTAHAGVRIGRKTHVVDLATGDRKAEYVALSNTVIGILLLAFGGLTAALVGLGLEIAIATLSLLALAGALLALRLKEVQH